MDETQLFTSLTEALKGAADESKKLRESNEALAKAAALAAPSPAGSGRPGSRLAAAEKGRAARYGGSGPGTALADALRASAEETKKLRESMEGVTARARATPGGAAGQNVLGGGARPPAGGAGAGLGQAAGAVGAAYLAVTTALGKAATAVEIFGNSSMTNAQKSEAFAKEFVPGAASLIKFRDAVLGVTDAIRKTERRFAEDSLRQGQRYERLGARLSGETEIGRNRNDEAAFAGLRPLAPGAFDRSTLAGEQRFQADERTRPLKDAENRARALADAAARTERESASRLNTLVDERGRLQSRLGEAKTRQDQAVAEENRQGLGRPGGRANKAARVQAGRDVELAAGDLATNELEIQRQNARYKEDGARSAERESAARKAAIAVQREELAILEAKAERIRGNARRIGGMTRAERARGSRAANLVKDRGYDKVSPRIREAAKRYAPGFIEKEEEQSGERDERYRRDKARGLFGDDTQSIKDINAQAAKVRAEVAVNVNLDEHALAVRIGEVLAKSFGNLIESITAKQKAEFDAFKAGLQVKNAMQ